jgi:hypothetical protein
MELGQRLVHAGQLLFYDGGDVGEVNGAARKASTATSLAALRSAAPPPPAQRLAGEPQRREADRVGRLEVQPRDLQQVEPRAPVAIRSGQASTWPIGTRMSGEPSCASIEPSAYSTRLWITDCGWTTMSIRSRQPEQVVRLDQLQALVHHGRAVDADLGAHRPIGVRHRLRRGDPRHLGGGEGRNGPPLAVRISLETRSQSCPARH